LFRRRSPAKMMSMSIGRGAFRSGTYPPKVFLDLLELLKERAGQDGGLDQKRGILERKMRELLANVHRRGLIDTRLRGDSYPRDQADQPFSLLELARRSPRLDPRLRPISIRSDILEQFQ